MKNPPIQKTADQLIEKFLLDTVSAAQLLYSNNLFGHLLIVMYSAIDSMGLLDAPPSQSTANGESFKNWVKKYLIPQGKFDFNDVDLWAARCSVLHTFTSISDLSNKGKARQVQYYSGPKDSPMAKAFVTATREIDNGAHVPGHIEDIYLAFLNGIKVFAEGLSRNCQMDPSYTQRLRQVLQSYIL